jgi:hypothetical protein
MKAIDKMTDHEVWLDWTNSFLSIETMAEHYSIGIAELRDKITSGRDNHIRLSALERAKKTLSDAGYCTGTLMNDFKLIETNKECCANCKGNGSECENGFAWVYCKTRSDNDDQFDGDCGESYGCNHFISAKANKA